MNDDGNTSHHGIIEDESSRESGGESRSSSPSKQASPYKESPWRLKASSSVDHIHGRHSLVESIIRQEGHVCSLAISNDLLYTGSHGKNIRVWKDMEERSGFKSRSGLVKAIVGSEGGRIFTGHGDGKIRVWRRSSKNLNVHSRIGSLPSVTDLIKHSVHPKNYVRVRRHRSVVRIKHYDAVSCLSLNVQLGLLYSGSWDKTVKVWRVSDFKCLESIDAHGDAVNAVASGLSNLLFTASADGSAKVWRRTVTMSKTTRHVVVQTLMEGESAVTSLAVNDSAGTLYCASSDGVVNYWQFRRRLGLIRGGILRGHKAAVLCLAAAKDLLCSGSADSSICVWRREKRQPHTFHSLLTGHTGPVKCLTVGESGAGGQSIVYSGSLDRSVRIWMLTG